MEISGRKLRWMLQDGVKRSYICKRYGLTRDHLQVLLDHPYWRHRMESTEARATAEARRQ